MKIAMITLNVIGRGTYLRAYKFATELAKRGHEVTLIATKPKGWRGVSEYSEKSVRIVAFPDLFIGALRSGWDPYNTLQRIAWLRNLQFDIVHAFESRPTVIYPALYLKSKGAALVMDWCDWFGRGGAVEERPSLLIRTILRPVETYFEEHFRSQALSTTVICSTLYRRAVKLGLPVEKVLLLPNGFDMPELQGYDRQIAREKLGLPQDDFLIGYVGASFPHDVRLMEEAFALVIRNIPTARLIHVGRSNYSISPEAKNRNKILRTGDVDDKLLNYYLSACNICWLPLKDSNANRGRFPLKLTTYLAAGCPVVATMVGDLVPFYEQHNIGLLSKDDPTAIAEKILSLYQSPILLKEQSENALAIGHDPKLSWNQRTSDLEKVYLQLLPEFKAKAK